ncbi:MAG TPA: MBL fold metallo-hydrolase [Verrucomicrobiota bacterium]|nr:MBL fold metallo-hydrolase [Verrucomicrobiota bacterium]
MKLAKPFLADDALLADIQHARAHEGLLHVWWLGQSGFLVMWEGRCLLLDPYLSDSLTKKYANTDKPHVRITERVIAPEQLTFVDVVTASHHHTDHLDPETLLPLARVNPKLVLVCPEAARAIARERSGLPNHRIVGLDSAKISSPGTEVVRPVSVEGWELLAVPAAHETLETDRDGRHLYLGFVVKAGPWTLYHSGDTVLYPGMVERLRPFRIDLAMLPINGRAPERRVAGNLSGREAAQLASTLRVGVVIPCHYDMFEFNTASPDEFVTTCQHLGQNHVVLLNGQRWSTALPWSAGGFARANHGPELNATDALDAV